MGVVKETFVITVCSHSYFFANKSEPSSVRPDLAIYWTLGKFLKPLATINLPKAPTFLGNF